MELVKTQKGKDMICFRGFIYRKGRVSKSSVFWRCVKSRCNGTATTGLNYAEEAEIRERKQHNHLPSPGRQKAAVAIHMLTTRAVTSNESPARIVDDIVAGLATETTMQLPQRKSLTKRILRKRRRDENLPLQTATKCFCSKEYTLTKHQGEQELHSLLRPKFRKTSKNMTTNGYSHEKVQEAANYLKSLVDFSPRIGIICGSGLSGLGEDVKNKIVVKYGNIPHYVTSTVAGHKGQLVFGDISGKHVMCMQGRFHPYEGYEPWKIALPIRVMKLLGVEIIIITNAAGGLNRAYNVGDFMILKDHISFPGLGGYNPLRGPNDDKFGPRFPAVTPAYDRDLQNLLRETSENLGFKDSTRSGVYCNVAGPSYETIAEMRMLLQLGADSIGMSTAQEVVAAAHAGMKVVVCSLITNKCILDYDSKESANHEEVLETGKKRADDMKKLITEFIKVLQLVIPNSE